jgi:hypothetical protein
MDDGLIGSGGHTTSEADEAELSEISTMFASDRRFKIESQIFNCLLSLCDDVSPSDYFQSGASNVAVSAASASTPSSFSTAASSNSLEEDEAIRDEHFASAINQYREKGQWTPEMLDNYHIIRGIV